MFFFSSKSVLILASCTVATLFLLPLFEVYKYIPSAQSVFASNLCLMFFRLQTKSKFVFRKQHINGGSVNACHDEAGDAPLQWQRNPTLTLSTQKFLLICLVNSSTPLGFHSHAVCVFLYSIMTDSSLIFVTELFPADAAESFTVLLGGVRAYAAHWLKCMGQWRSKADLLMSQSVHQSPGHSHVLPLLCSISDRK